MKEKVLGKIAEVSFGYTGYQEQQFGLFLEFKLAGGYGVSTTIAESWAIDMKCTEHSKWTEADRMSGFANTMRKINELMKQAKVQEVSKLKGIPIEVTLEGNLLKEWRILEEVL